MAALAALPMLVGAADLSKSAQFSLNAGVVYYLAEDGKPTAIHLDKKCADLWVAPDGSAITFIGVDEVRGPDNTGHLPGEQMQPLIERSSVYVSRRSDRFAAVRVVSGSFEIDGRTWEVLRHPSLSPDGKELFFIIPYTMTTSKLISYSIVTGRHHTVGDATDYCVLWHGPYSGDQILQRRHLRSGGAAGVSYRCYLRGAAATSIISANCPMFEEFASSWAKKNGGTCPAPHDED